jgi:uncharacterized protein YjbJ (UPF0337 family)
MRNQGPWANAAPGTTVLLQRYRFNKDKESIMDREHVKGMADKAKGSVKDVAGKMMGDKKLQAEGKFDKAKGAAHNVAGDVKDAAKDAADESSKSKGH